MPSVISLLCRLVKMSSPLDEQHQHQHDQPRSEYVSFLSFLIDDLESECAFDESSQSFFILSASAQRILDHHLRPIIATDAHATLTEKYSRVQRLELFETLAGGDDFDSLMRFWHTAYIHWIECLDCVILMYNAVENPSDEVLDFSKCSNMTVAGLRALVHCLTNSDGDVDSIAASIIRISHAHRHNDGDGSSCESIIYAIRAMGFSPFVSLNLRFLRPILPRVLRVLRRRKSSSSALKNVEKSFASFRENPHETLHQLARILRSYSPHKSNQHCQMKNALHSITDTKMVMGPMETTNRLQKGLSRSPSPSHSKRSRLNTAIAIAMRRLGIMSDASWSRIRAIPTSNVLRNFCLESLLISSPSLSMKAALDELHGLMEFVHDPAPNSVLQKWLKRYDENELSMTSFRFFIGVQRHVASNSSKKHISVSQMLSSSSMVQAGFVILNATFADMYR